MTMRKTGSWRIRVAPFSNSFFVLAGLIFLAVLIVSIFLADGSFNKENLTGLVVSLAIYTILASMFADKRPKPNT